MKYITEFDKYFVTKGDRMVFIGNTMKVIVPQFYETYGMLRMDAMVDTLGILRCEINGTSYFNLMLLAIIRMAPSSIDTETIDGDPYVVLSFVKGDTFISHTRIVKSADVLYNIYVMTIALGKMPKFIAYEHIHRLFDQAKLTTGVDLGIQKSAFSMILSHIYRTNADPSVGYRYSDMKEDPVVVALHMIAYSPDSNLAKIMGSYMGEGLTSATVSSKTSRMEVEEVFRA